jgi:hypothetical protein
LKPIGTTDHFVDHEVIYAAEFIPSHIIDMYRKTLAVFMVSAFVIAAALLADCIASIN